LDQGVAQALIEKSGSWFSYDGQRIGQGRENARQFLVENPEVCAKLETDLRKLLGIAAENTATLKIADDEGQVSSKAAKIA